MQALPFLHFLKILFFSSIAEKGSNMVTLKKRKAFHLPSALVVIYI